VIVHPAEIDAFFQEIALSGGLFDQALHGAVIVAGIVSLVGDNSFSGVTGLSGAAARGGR
jgi:hypothetical protein